MGLFKADLYRSFAVGFALGTAALVAVMSGQSDRGLKNQVIPSAQAATLHTDQTLIDAAR